MPQKPARRTSFSVGAFTYHANEHKSEEDEQSMENFRHLGGNPEEWETAQGTIAERTAAVGRSSIDFRERQGLGDGASNTKSWMKVQSLGAEAMQLVRAQDDPLHKIAQASVVEHSEAYDDRNTFQANSDDDDESNHVEDPSADVNAILDADYDTSAWSLYEIESACDTLLLECETTAVLRRRLLATRMLLRLIDRHSEARRFVEVAFETIVNRGIPNMSYGISDRTFCVAYMLAAVAPRLSEKLSTLNVIPRIAKMILREPSLAAQVIQDRVRLIKRERIERAQKAAGEPAPPRDVRARQRLMARMRTDDLLGRFRLMRESPHGGRLGHDVLVAYLEAVNELTAATTTHRAQNREQFVHAGAMLVVAMCLKDADPHARALARSILLQVGQEASLLRLVLLAQTVPALVRGFVEPTARCAVLECLDVLAIAAAHSATRLPVDETADGILRLAGPPTFDAAAAGPVEPAAADRDACRRFFASPKVVELVLQGLHSEQADEFLGCVVVAHKLSCSVFYHTVLFELVARGGLPLERALDAFQSTHELLAVAVAALVANVATRPEGRDALLKTGAIEMVRHLLSPAKDPDAAPFVLALSMACALAEHATLAPIACDADALDVNPARLRDRLYQNLAASLTRPPPASRAVADRLVELGLMEPLLRFLVRPGHPAHFFGLPKQQRFLGGFILHRLACHRPIEVFHDATLMYGAFLLQHNYGEMWDPHGVAAMRPEDVPLFYLSTQAACALLAELGASPEPPDARAQVLEKLKYINALPEVVGLLAYPEAKHDQLYRHKMECVTAAALLLAASAPRPLADALPEASLEAVADALTDAGAATAAAACAQTLEDLVGWAAPKLLRLVQCCDNRTAVAAACLALARLAATNPSAKALVALGAVPAAASLVPGRPTVQHDMTSAEKDKLMSGDAAQMARLPPSFFRLVQALARVPEGLLLVQTTGLFKRSVERMATGDGGLHDLGVKTEVALLLARLAHAYSDDFGSSAELMTTTKFGLVPALVEMLADQSHPRRTRFAGARALRCLCDDVSRTVPVVVAAAGTGPAAVIPRLVAVVREPSVAHPLLREVLETLRLIASAPTAAYTAALVDAGAVNALQAIAADLKLEVPYQNAQMNRVTLGEVARDALASISDDKARRAVGTKATVLTEARAGALREASEGPTAESRGGSAGGAVVALPALVPRGPPLDGTYRAIGISSHGSLVQTRLDVATTAGPRAGAGGAATPEITPLALLSAREGAFRAELRRRKRYYHLDATGSLAAEEATGLALASSDRDGDDDEAGSLAGSSTVAHAHVPIIATKGRGGGGPLAVATVNQNPHLARTRPPSKPRAAADEVAAAAAAMAAAAAAFKPVPLARQKRHQPVALSHPLSTLMLDPVFSDGLANVAGDKDRAGDAMLVRQANAALFGAEQFSHVALIGGHEVRLTAHRPTPGRIAESGAHATTTNFRNAESGAMALQQAQWTRGQKQHKKRLD